MNTLRHFPFPFVQTGRRSRRLAEAARQEREDAVKAGAQGAVDAVNKT